MTTLTNISLSMLDLVAVREGGTVAEALAISLRTARHVETLGFKRYWLAEHHNMAGIASSATAVLVGHIAGGKACLYFKRLSDLDKPVLEQLVFGSVTEIKRRHGTGSA